MDAEQLVEPDLERRLRDSEYRYKNLFNAMAAYFWEIDFRGVGVVLRRLRDEGITDLEVHFQVPANVRELLQAARVIDCNERTVSVFSRGSKPDLMTSIDPFWPEKSYPVFVQSVMAFLEKRKSFLAETVILTIDGQERDILFTSCYPNELAYDGTMLIGMIDLSDTKRALHEARQANIRANTLAEAQAFSFWQLDATNTNRMMAELREQGVRDLGAYIDEHPEFLEAALDATIVTDINQKSVDLYGLKDKSEAIGKGIKRYWAPGGYEAFRGSLEAGFRGISQYQQVTKTKTVDGRIVDCRYWMAAPSEMRANGTVMVAIQDLTDEIASQRQIEQLREGLAHAGRVLMLGEFTASIAHEINQPLAAVRAASSAARRWLSMDPPDLDQAALSLANIARSAHRAGEIIDRIRGMVVKRQPERTLVGIRSLVDEAVEFVSRECQIYKTTPVVRIPRNLPDILVDRTQIQQVLVNLIINALQAMDQAQTVARTVTVEARLGADRMIIFSVRDSGPGVDPDNVKRLFEHFFTTKDGGMGIGLTICQSIIQAHDGRIEARNAPDGGADFTFSLAVVVADSSTYPAAQIQAV